MPLRDRKAGKRLRNLRKQAGLTMSEVEDLTRELARSRRNPRLRVPKGRLSEIETKGQIPSIYRLHALATAYDTNMSTVLGFYGLKP